MVATPTGAQWPVLNSNGNSRRQVVRGNGSGGRTNNNNDNDDDGRCHDGDDGEGRKDEPGGCAGSSR